jgi:hypothetical protein
MRYSLEMKVLAAVIGVLLATSGGSRKLCSKDDECLKGQECVQCEGAAGDQCRRTCEYPCRLSRSRGVSCPSGMGMECHQYAGGPHSSLGGICEPSSLAAPVPAAGLRELIRHLERGDFMRLAAYGNPMSDFAYDQEAVSAESLKQHHELYVSFDNLKSGSCSDGFASALRRVKGDEHPRDAPGREDLRVVFELSDASGASKAAIYVNYSRSLLFEQSAWSDATPLLDWLKAHPANCLNSESRLR